MRSIAALLCLLLAASASAQSFPFPGRPGTADTAGELEIVSVCSWNSGGTPATTTGALDYDGGTAGELAEGCVDPTVGDLVTVLFVADAPITAMDCTDLADGSAEFHEVDGTTDGSGRGEGAASRSDSYSQREYHVMGTTGTSFSCSWTTSTTWAIALVTLGSADPNTFCTDPATACAYQYGGGYSAPIAPNALTDQGTTPWTFMSAALDNQPTREITACPDVPAMTKMVETTTGATGGNDVWLCYYAGAIGTNDAFTANGSDGYTSHAWTANLQ